jgi:hypothetical protein
MILAPCPRGTLSALILASREQNPTDCSNFPTPRWFMRPRWQGHATMTGALVVSYLGDHNRTRSSPISIPLQQNKCSPLFLRPQMRSYIRIWSESSERKEEKNVVGINITPPPPPLERKPLTHKTRSRLLESSYLSHTWLPTREKKPFLVWGEKTSSRVWNPPSRVTARHSSWEEENLLWRMYRTLALLLWKQDIKKVAEKDSGHFRR